MKILIIGASGMLGHMLFSELLRRDLDVYGTIRKPLPVRTDWTDRLIHFVDITEFGTLEAVIDRLTPDVVINAAGLIRHLPEGREPLPCIRINAAFPHRLMGACSERGIRLIHYSTDCVFDGSAGRPYTESDRPTATDVYGITKFLGEVTGPTTLTLRTSIIGPELRGRHSLVEWFLAQEGPVRGFSNALYTGLPSSEHARVLIDFILPRPDLHGLYQVASEPISKYALLRMLADIYEKSVVIVPDADVRVDKRLSGEAFRSATGYTAPDWPSMLSAMRTAHLRSGADWV